METNVSDEKQPDKYEQAPEGAESPAIPATSETAPIPADLEAARRAAGRGPNGAGPYRGRKRPPYSIMD